MTLPYFYYASLHEGHLTLDEDTSRHVISVLRMNEGETILLTYGKGNKAMATISSEAAVLPRITIAISLLKNTSRFEWFLEKATEIGVTAIVPLISRRTEKEKFRADRLTSILISAMLQSQQSWLPEMKEPLEF